MKRYQPPEFTYGPRAASTRVVRVQNLRRSAAAGPHADGAPRVRQRGQARRAAVTASVLEG